MRSEDRKPAKRVFPLLQNLDLDSVTFDQIQGVGDPITIEDMNEQELQDLVLVNLARLAVSGEWTGLLEAGGGSAQVVGPSLVEGETYNTIAQGPVWGNSSITTGTVGNSPSYYPFLAGETGTVSAIAIQVTTASSGMNALVGIYSSSDDGLPDVRAGYATISLESTGTIEQTTITGSIELTKNTQYWAAICKDANGTPVPEVSATTNNNAYGYTPLGIGNSPKDYEQNLYDVGASQELPATITVSNLYAGTDGSHCIGLKY